MSRLPRTLILRQPPHVVIGAGCMTSCAALVAESGAKQVLLVLSARALPSAGPLMAALEERDIAVRHATDVPLEPDVATFERVRGREREYTTDAVIGFGGGSALDIAKLLAALLRRPEPVHAFFGSGLLPRREIFLACLPTTAGSGSEVSPNALLLDEKSQQKKAVISPWLVPDAAVIDPVLAESLPAATTAATGLDALVHCIEAYANRNAHPLVDMYAIAGIGLIARHLVRAVNDGGDAVAREALARGSLYGGLCLGPVNTAAVHALAYPLGGEFRIGHGLSNALLLPHVLRFNISAAPERYADVARALGAEEAATPLETAQRGVQQIEQLARDCHLPRGLFACGIPASAIPRLVASAMTVTRLLQNNPRAVTAADATEIYQAAL